MVLSTLIQIFLNISPVWSIEPISKFTFLGGGFNKHGMFETREEDENAAEAFYSEWRKKNQELEKDTLG